MKVQEIKSELTRLGVTFKSKASKAELIALMKTAHEKELSDLKDSIISERLSMEKKYPDSFFKRSEESKADFSAFIAENCSGRIEFNTPQPEEQPIDMSVIIGHRHCEEPNVITHKFEEVVSVCGKVFLLPDENPLSWNWKHRKMLEGAGYRDMPTIVFEGFSKEMTEVLIEEIKNKFIILEKYPNVLGHTIKISPKKWVITKK